MVNANFATSFLSQAYKVLLAPVLPVESRVAAKSQLSKAAFNEVFDDQLADGQVIGLYPRNVGQVACSADIDDRAFYLSHHGRDLVVFDASNDAVALPVGQPGWRSRPSLLFGKKHRPWFVMSDVVGDAAQYAPRVGIG